jgi:tetratricopeptide (TPR) repeat protein
MRMRTLPVLIAGLLAMLPSLVWGAGGGSSGTGGSFSAPREMTPEEQARSAYNQGVRSVKQADKYSKAAMEATSEEKKAKSLEKAQKQYAKARDYFVAAVRLKAEMHEAWNYIGYTSRKLGEYDHALTAYDEALRLKPTYAEAIEYRGEAYLALNRLDDAKGAYMSLFRDARPLADQLMVAMKQWVTDRRANAGALDAGHVDEFARWIDERATIASQTASLAVGGKSLAWN